MTKKSIKITIYKEIGLFFMKALTIDIIQRV